MAKRKVNSAQRRFSELDVVNACIGHIRFRIPGETFIDSMDELRDLYATSPLFYKQVQDEFQQEKMQGERRVQNLDRPGVEKI